MSTKCISGNSTDYFPTSLIGGKAQGLLTLQRILPTLEPLAPTKIPPFFIVPAHNNIDNNTIDYYANQLGCTTFAVRSSSPLEDGINHSWDGIFETNLGVSRLNLREAIRSVRASATCRKAHQYAADFGLRIDPSMGVIVQEMISLPHQGIIYSAFPASVPITKVISEHSNGTTLCQRKISIIRRTLCDGKPKSTGSKLVEGEGLSEQSCATLANVSYAIEHEFRYPVRIEYQSTRDEVDAIYLLQARAIAGMNNTTEHLSHPHLAHPGQLLVSTHDVNGTGKYTLPAVVIISQQDYTRNIPHEEVQELDRQFTAGYVLLCNYLDFWGKEYDSITPHKKAVVSASNQGRWHDQDIARKRGLLYVGSETFFQEFKDHLRWPLRTGDVVEVRGDGVTGLLYKMN